MGECAEDEVTRQIPYFVALAHSLQMVFGVSAVAANLVIVVALYFKRTKSPTEVLVLFHSFLDGVYGLFLMLAALFSLAGVIDWMRCRLPVAACLFIYADYTFLVFASLLLIQLITVNRYVSVEFPFEYKSWFTLGRTRAALALILALTTLHTVPELLMCSLPPPPAAQSHVYSNQSDGLYLNQSHQAVSWQFDWRNAYTQFWYWSKTVLVAVNACALLATYRAISTKFSRPVGGFKLTVASDLNNRKSATARKLQKMKNTPSRNMLGVEMSEMTTAAAAGSSSAFVSLENLKSPPPPPPPETRAHSPGHSQSACALLEKPPQLSESQQGMREKEQRVTRTLFLGSVGFILISTPITLHDLLQEGLHLYRLGGVPNFVVVMVTDILYSVNFLLSAFVFMYNNSYMHEVLHDCVLRVTSRFQTHTI